MSDVNHINEMIKAAVAGTPASFKQHFQAEINERIVDAIALKKMDVVAEVFGIVNEEEVLSEDDIAMLESVLEQLSEEDLTNIIENEEYLDYFIEQTLGQSIKNGAKKGAKIGAGVGGAAGAVGGGAAGFATGALAGHVAGGGEKTGAISGAAGGAVAGGGAGAALGAAHGAIIGGAAGAVKHGVKKLAGAIRGKK